MEQVLNKKSSYTIEEDIVNVFTHLIGSIFSLGILIYFIYFQVRNEISFLNMFGYYIYFFFMFVMFTMSTIYHSRPLDSKSRKICQRIDHSDIYLFISATYTPFCLYCLSNHLIGHIVLIVNWSISIIACILNLTLLNKKFVKIASIFAYVIIGWMIILVNPLSIGMSHLTFNYLFSGGAVFTLGVILYAIGRKRKWFHSVFHLFVLAGVILQFISVLTLLSC